MIVRRGIAVSPGVAMGPALILGVEDFRIPRQFVKKDAVDTEAARFRSALDATCEEISENERLASQQLGSQYAAIFNAHLQMIRDPNLVDEIEALIREKHHSSEAASSKVLRRYAKVFQNLGNEYFAERAADIFDIEKRLLRHLLGKKREAIGDLTEPVLVLAHNLTPSETAGLHREFVRGFATEAGGHTSHTAILAGALEIPAIVGVGSFLSDISGGETIIIDGNSGEIVIGPDEATLARYHDSEKEFKTHTLRLESLHTLNPETADGVRIQLYGNIEFPEEAAHCLERGADGVGLYRTEFLYLGRDTEPDEDAQYDAYSRVVSAMQGRPVVIRTLDLGADKFPGASGRMGVESHNPMLGLRSIRLSLQNLPMFKRQLRAILRASAHGSIRIMFPLVSSLMELRQAKMIVSDVMEDLEEAGVPFAHKVPVGMMVEVPSAALLAEEFAREVDFFSIGTNDLIQYTLAVDRGDPAVAKLYSSGDPALLRLIAHVIDAARKHDVPVSVCGQMSSDPKFTALLLGMGLRQLSVTPHAIPEIKQAIRALKIPQAEEIAARAATLEVSRDIENYLRGELKKACPELVH